MVTISERFDSLGFDGTPARLGIMGGTFDPIHIGHLACAEQVWQQLGLDGVLFVPTGRPPFKAHRNVSPGEDRLAMCALAIADNQHFDVSSIEIDRPGPTYTIDTLRALRAYYPPWVEFSFITGADALENILRWHEREELASLASFVGVTRPGTVLEPSFFEELRASGFSVELIEVTALALSSSYLRDRVAQDKTIRYLTRTAVIKYIIEQGLYHD